MENYTKYRLKSTEELTQLLTGLDQVFVVSCNKCFKEYDVLQEQELDTFVKLAKDLGKTVTGTTRIDFLCNKTQTAKALQIPEGTEAVVVLLRS